MLEVQVGKTIDSYRIIRQLGMGGMGEVYLAEEVELRRLVAIKFLRSEAFDSQWKSRFLREAKILSTLRHKNICAFYRYGLWQDELPYIVVEYMEGITLEELCRTKRISFKTSLIIGLQICEALAYLHSQDVVHRDLKPANVMVLGQEKEQPTVRVIDFGLAASISSSSSGKLTRSGQLLGSPAYMSPEQCSGQKSDYRSDNYALGCILFELISGEQVFQADHPMALIVKHATEIPRHLSDLAPRVSRRIDKLVYELLAKDPALRPALANVGQELEQVLTDDPQEVTVIAKRKVRSTAVASAVLVIVSSLLAVTVTNQQQPTSSVALRGVVEELHSEKSSSKRELIFQRYFASPTIPVTAVTFAEDGSGGLACEYQTVVEAKLNDLAADSDWKKALEFCDSCIEQSKSILGSTPRNRLVAFLELRRATCLLLCGDSKQANDIFASALVHLEGRDKYKAVIGLERSLVALKKYTEAEDAILKFLDEQQSSKNFPEGSRDTLYLELGRIKWIRNDNAAASRYFSLAGKTTLQQLKEIPKLSTLDLPLYYQKLELLGLVYLFMGDKPLAGDSLWLAAADAHFRKQKSESRRMRSTILRLAGLAEDSAADPTVVANAADKAWHDEKGTIAQINNTIDVLERLLSPRSYIASEYLRKSHLWAQECAWANCETAARLSLKNSSVGPGEFDNTGALQFLHLALLHQKKFAEAMEIFKLARQLPCDSDVSQILARSYAINRQDRELHELYDDLTRHNAQPQALFAGYLLVDRMIEQRDFRSARLLLETLESKQLPNALAHVRPCERATYVGMCASLKDGIVRGRPIRCLLPSR